MESFRLIDCHFHWRPRSVFEEMCKRTGFPRAERNGKGGYTYWLREGNVNDIGPEWFDLDRQLAHMDSTGREIDVVCSAGTTSDHFCELPASEGRDAAHSWNEEMAGAQSGYPGRVWATAAVPLQDTGMALEVLEHATGNLGLVGVNLPGSVGRENIDAARLEPFYDRVEQLGVPLMLHPADAAFHHVLDGYDGALYLSLGRVIDVSVSAFRLVLSGIMERHPGLKVFTSHIGGALPYQAGRMDKNSKAAKLKKSPSTYLRRMYTDTVSPHAMGLKFAIDFYGAEQVMYGTDYPCWDPKAALQVLEEVVLSKEDKLKVLRDNARRFFGLRDAVPHEQETRRRTAAAS